METERFETGIRIEGSELKIVREALCVAQGAISRSYVGNQRAYGQRYAQRLAVLIERIDEARPLGSNGKHDSLHTDVCGCEGAKGSVEYEYNIQTTDDDGESYISFWEWSLVPDGLEKDLAELVQWDKDVDTGSTRRLVRRRRAGKVEVVDE